MIVNFEHLRRVRALSESMDNRKLVPYIEEAENLHVRPTITPELYKLVEAAVLVDNSGVPVASNAGENIALDGEYDLLLLGGYYDDGAKYFAGLIAAEAYLAYSRFVMQHGLTAASFGMVRAGSGDYSQQPDYKQIKSASADAERIGLKYLAECVEYLKFTGELPSSATARKKHRIRTIGD